MSTFSSNGMVYSIQLYVTYLDCESIFFQWYGVLNTTLCDSLKLWVRFLPMVKCTQYNSMWITWLWFHLFPMVRCTQYNSMWLTKIMSSFSSSGMVYSIQLYVTHLDCESIFFQWYGVLNITLCDSLKLWVRFLLMARCTQYNSMWLT